jgi:DnaK suppressor protein
MIKPIGARSRSEFILSTREHLESMKVSLVAELARAARAAHSEATGSMDSADLASKELEQTMAVTLSARERGRIVEIDEALERMDEGSYGMCAACGFEIGDERLQAIPFARHCRDCQHDQERRAKGTSSRTDVDQERSDELGSSDKEGEI